MVQYRHFIIAHYPCKLTKPMKTLELHFPMIQILIHALYPDGIYGIHELLSNFVLLTNQLFSHFISVKS